MLCTKEVNFTALEIWVTDESDTVLSFCVYIKKLNIYYMISILILFQESFKVPWLQTV